MRTRTTERDPLLEAPQKEKIRKEYSGFFLPSNIPPVKSNGSNLETREQGSLGNVSTLWYSGKDVKTSEIKREVDHWSEFAR